MKCDKAAISRLKRIQGQMGGVLKMMEEERSCEDIVMQLSAIRTSIDRLTSLITTNNLIQTIEENYQIELNDIDEALNLVVKNR